MRLVSKSTSQDCEESGASAGHRRQLEVETEWTTRQSPAHAIVRDTTLSPSTMSIAIECLYILDDQGCLLEHIYNGRPPAAKDVYAHLRSQKPRPAVQHLATLNPPTTLYTVTHGALLLTCTSAKDVPPQAIIDFLYRLIDIFEDFLGSPLIGNKIQENYDVVAQLLVEVCDGGIISNTEGNALRERVEVSSTISKLFAQVSLPNVGASSPSVGPTNLAATLKAASSAANGPAIPWRKANVRHTSNELYVDMVENMSVIFAPSGRPLSARARGSILFTAKISGVPDLLLTLSAPGGSSMSKSAGLTRTMQLPSFHPCVRLHRWRDTPGELSFVPPDGKFMLASYETELLATELNTSEPPSRSSDFLFLPVTPDLRTGLGRSGADFEARITLTNTFPGAPPPASKPGPSRAGTGVTPFSFGNMSGGGSAAPTLEAVMITIPFPEEVRGVTELKPSRGEASFNQFTHVIEWRIPTSDGFSVSGVATLTGTVAGPLNNAGTDDALDPKTQSLSEYYDDTTLGRRDSGDDGESANGIRRKAPGAGQGSRALMPRSIAASFAVKGWLASGIKVTSLVVDSKRSKGLGDGVKPYKGVKYLTVSRNGVERRVDG
jgi:AP-3 complex subunit mu